MIHHRLEYKCSTRAHPIGKEIRLLFSFVVLGKGVRSEPLLS